MRRLVSGVFVAVLVGVVAPSSGALPLTSGTVAPRPVAGTSCRAFPADNWWHADVSGLPVDSRSDAWRSRMHTERDLHPDFGPA